MPNVSGAVTMQSQSFLSPRGGAWAPNTCRTLFLNCAGRASGSGSPWPWPAQWPDTNLANVEDFSIDGTSWLSPGDYITSATGTSITLDVLASAIWGKTMASFWLTSGAGNTQNQLDVTLISAANRRLQLSAGLYVWGPFTPTPFLG